MPFTKMLIYIYQVEIEGVINVMKPIIFKLVLLAS